MTAVGRAAPRFAAGAACYALCSRGSLMGMHSLDLGGDPARLLRAPTRPSAILESRHNTVPRHGRSHQRSLVFAGSRGENGEVAS